MVLLGQLLEQGLQRAHHGPQGVAHDVLLLPEVLHHQCRPVLVRLLGEADKLGNLLLRAQREGLGQHREVVDSSVEQLHGLVVAQQLQNLVRRLQAHLLPHAAHQLGHGTLRPLLEEAVQLVRVQARVVAHLRRLCGVLSVQRLILVQVVVNTGERLADKILLEAELRQALRPRRPQLQPALEQHQAVLLRRRQGRQGGQAAQRSGPPPHERR
mmetsp:Transcript_61598/g.198361  ORF Transcript_61598/g.198361 Transcript_61598/m.198361 type:complete len:213 (+) Transcript_61598:607-1245(+)